MANTSKLDDHRGGESNRPSSRLADRPGQEQHPRSHTMGSRDGERSLNSGNAATPSHSSAENVNGSTGSARSSALARLETPLASSSTSSSGASGWAAVDREDPGPRRGRQRANFNRANLRVLEAQHPFVERPPNDQWLDGSRPRWLGATVTATAHARNGRGRVLDRGPRAPFGGRDPVHPQGGDNLVPTPFARGFNGPGGRDRVAEDLLRIGAWARHQGARH